MPLTSQRPRVIGHRGARRLAIENTLESLRIALEEGADGVEFDVQRSADGELFVFHDDDLRRLCGLQGSPADWRWRDLRGLTLACPGLPRGRIPHLDEVIELLEPTAAQINAELKVDKTRGRDNGRALAEAFARRMRGVVANNWLVSSFERTALEPLPDLDGGLRLAALLQQEPCAWQGLAERELPAFPIVSVNPEWPLVAEDRVVRWHAQGWQIWTWTPNDAYTWFALMQHGVDALITDDPGALVRFLEREQA